MSFRYSRCSLWPDFTWSYQSVSFHSCREFDPNGNEKIGGKWHFYWFLFHLACCENELYSNPSRVPPCEQAITDPHYSADRQTLQSVFPSLHVSSPTSIQTSQSREDKNMSHHMQKSHAKVSLWLLTDYKLHLICQIFAILCLIAEGFFRVGKLNV